MKQIKQSLKNEIYLIIKRFHLIVFGHAMSNVMESFLKNLSWSFFGGATASAIMFFLNLIAGRKLGPDAFGQYNYILSFSTALTIFFLLGNDVSSVRYLSDKKYEKDKEEIFTTSVMIVIFQSFLFGLIFYLFFELIKIKFSLSQEILLVGIIFSFLLAMKSLFDGYLRAFRLIKRQSFIRIFDSILAIVAFLFFYYFLDKKDYFFYIIAISVGLLFFISASLIALFGNFKKFSIKAAKLLFSYNRFLILGAGVGFIIGLEKYFIGRYIGTYELGIFSAYHAASFLIISNIGYIFMNVFWPSSIMEKQNLEAISKKLNILFVKIFPFWIIFNFFFIFLAVFFMGKDYPLNFSYIFLFAITSYLSFTFSIVNGLLKINRIKEFVLMSYLCYMSLIVLIILFKNILLYLIGQVFVYFVFCIISNKILAKDFKRVFMK